MRIPALAALATSTALVLSACGGGGSSTATDTTGTGPAGSAGLHVASTSLGKVIVDGDGMTLYVLSADSHDHSTCSSSCLHFWPAVAPASVSGIQVTTGHASTPDGTPIATVAGRPVYTFALDQAPGDVNGEGRTEFGGTWYAVSPSGHPVKPGGAPSSPSSSYTRRGY